MSFPRVSIIVAGLVAGLSIAAVAVAQDLPPGEGREVVQTACTSCHGVDLLTPRTPDEWKDTVGRMVGNGASLNDQQYEVVVKYLSTALRAAAPPARPAPPAAGARPATPPDPTVH